MNLCIIFYVNLVSFLLFKNILSLKFTNPLTPNAFREVVNKIRFSFIIIKNEYRENYELYDQILAQLGQDSSFVIKTLEFGLIDFQVMIFL